MAVMSSEAEALQSTVFAEAALHMPDILGEIFPLCSIETQEIATHVCVEWRRLTLRPVWRVVRKPLKLLNALSALTEDRKSFQSVPSPADWRSFEPIASCVHEIVFDFDSTYIAQAIVQALSHSTCVPKPMCVNLARFAWKLPDVSNAAFIYPLHMIFLHPGLSSLQLHGIPKNSSDASVQYRLEHLARAVGNLAPNITDLTITTRTIPTSNRTASMGLNIAHIFSLLPKLRIVKLSPCFLTGPVYEALRYATHLESLVAYIDYDPELRMPSAGDVGRALEHYVPPEIPQSVFASLTDITLCMPIEMATGLLSLAQFPAAQLTRLSMRSTGQVNVSNEAVRAFFTAFCLHCPHVAKFIIMLDHPIQPPPVLENDMQDMDLLDALTLAPLRDAVQLEELVIRDSRGVIEATEDELLHIMDPLVRLRTLWIAPAPQWQTETRALLPTYTMGTAKRLIDGHPKLRSLGLYANLLYDFNGQVSDPEPGQLAELFLGTSPPHPTVLGDCIAINLATTSRVHPLGHSSWYQWGFNKGVFVVEDIEGVLFDGWATMRFSDRGNQYAMARDVYRKYRLNLS